MNHSYPDASGVFFKVFLNIFLNIGSNQNLTMQIEPDFDDFILDHKFPTSDLNMNIGNDEQVI